MKSLRRFLNLTDKRKIRKTGFVMMTVFSCLGYYALWKTNYILLSFFSIMLVFSLLFIFIPKRMTKIYGIWEGIAHYIGVLLTSIILFISYFLFFVPYALLIKLFKIDPLNNPKGLNSYWIDREEKIYNRERFKDLF